jgi:phage tail sheath protein FI
VAAPGLTGGTNYAALIAHCEALQDRVAILDPVETNAAFDNDDFTSLQNPTTATPPGLRPANSTFAAFYFPWVQVFDPAAALLTAKQSPPGDGLIFTPPSGHVAGIYARTDATRGVFKAPANEPVLGATGLRYGLTNADQDVLNDNGVNLIRPLTGAIRIWGARTNGGDANGNFKYISTRRFFNFLRVSIDQGTQFVVFEPNGPALWQRIIRSVGDFLLLQWREGALVGETPAKAFFVKCDADTNPPEVREAGQVVTEIGVAIIKPAEFVIFRIQQMTGG